MDKLPEAVTIGRKTYEIGSSGYLCGMVYLRGTRTTNRGRVLACIVPVEPDTLARILEGDEAYCSMIRQEFRRGLNMDRVTKHGDLKRKRMIHRWRSTRAGKRRRGRPSNKQRAYR